MQLPELSIRKPVLASMMALAIILFGIVGFLRLPVRELPDVDPPIVNVITVYPGASAEVMESQITEPIEEQLTTIEGIKTLTSQSREQLSSITIEFNLSRDVEIAAQDVRDRIARVRQLLPDDVDEPIVAKQDADAAPSIWIALFSERFTPAELTTLAEDVFKDKLQTVPGVSSVIFAGTKRFAIRLWLDSEKMAARGISVLDVQQALQQQNIELPSGRVENRNKELSIQTLGELKQPAEYDNLVIRQNGTDFVRLKDIGRAESGVEDERAVARFNSQPSIGIGVIKQSKANLIDVAEGVKEELERLKHELPEGVHTSVPYDESTFVEKSVHEVTETLLISCLLVVVTIFIFLKNFRSTMIPAIMIPICLIGTFAVMAMLGYSINIVTLLALVLAIGLVVDDVIIVLENIYRHMEMGKSVMRASLDAMNEIVFAVMATTIALVAVFFPLAIQSTDTGRLFIEFAVAMSVAVLISAFCALSTGPMIASRILRPIHGTESKYKFLDPFDRFLKRLNENYASSLRWALTHRMTVLMIALASLALGIFFFIKLDKEFLPSEDKGRLLNIAITPEGSTSEYTDRQVRKMEEILKQTPEVEGYFSAVALSRGGPGKANEGLAFVRMKEKRDKHITEIVGGPTGLGARFFGEIEGALVIPIIPKAIGTGFSQPFQLVLQGPDLAKLNEFATQFSGKLRQEGYLMNVRSTFEMNKPELRVHIDRDRASALGVSIRDIAQTMQILFGGLDLSKVHKNGKEYDVIVQLEREKRLMPEDLDRLYVRGTGGQLVQLSNVVSFQSGGGPNSIDHYNRFRSATIEGTPIGLPLGTAMERTTQMLKAELPADFRYEWAGESRDLTNAGNETAVVFVFAVLILYMVLASQFGSLIHPLTVMLSLPLAAFGAFGSLLFLSWVNKMGEMFYGWSHYAPNPPAIAGILSNIFPKIPGMNLNLFSQIGLVLLIGLVTKNAILLVDFANRAREEGADAVEAMIQAGTIRLRPILMTTFATVIGIIPIAIGFGAGAESRRPLGVVTVGGVTVSAFLTLFVIPVVYVMLDRFVKRPHKEEDELPVSTTGGKTGIGNGSTHAIIFVLAATTLLSGCAVGNNYSRPQTELPKSWKTNSSSGTLVEPIQDAAQNLLSEKWWEIFNDVELNALIVRALENNQTLKAAVARVDQARALARSEGGKFFPTISGGGAYTRSRSVLTFPGATVAGTGPTAFVQNNFRVPLDLTYEVDVWGRVRRAFEARNALADAAAEDYRAILLTSTTDLAMYYFLVRQLDSEFLALKQTADLRDKALNVVNDRYTAGIVSELDLTRAKAEVASVEVETLELKRRRSELVNAIATLCGTTDQDFDIPFKAVQPEPPSVPAGLPSELLERRPDVFRAEWQLAAANAQIGVAQANFLPSFRLTSSAGYESLELRSLFDWEQRTWSFGPSVHVPLFAGGRNDAELKRAEAQYNENLAVYRQSVIVAFQEVRDALTNVRYRDEEAQAQNGLLESARRAGSLSINRYQEGLATFLEVVDAERSRLQAERQAAQIRSERMIAALHLIKALGGSYEKTA